MASQEPISRAEILAAPKGVIPGKRWLRKMTALYNCVRLGKTVLGSSPDFQPAATGLVVQVPISSSGTNASSSSYRGEFDPSGATQFGSGPFNFGDEVRVSPTNTNATTMGGSITPGIYVYVNGSSTTGNLPNHILSPGGETAYWQTKSTFPSTAQTCDGAGHTITVFVDEQTGTL